MKTLAKSILKDGDYNIQIAQPSLRRLIPCNLFSANWHDSIRWLIQYPWGYRVYCLSEGDKQIAYCVISNGGSPRYPFASKHDIIVWPYFVDPARRGKGLATLLVKKILCEFETSYRYAYAFIDDFEIASIKTIQAVGFEHWRDCTYTKFSRILRAVEKGQGEKRLYRLESREEL